MPRHHSLFVLLSPLLLLVACGGASDSGYSIPGPTAADSSNAAEAGVRASLDLATSLATLRWADTFPNASRYQIERRGEDGTWSVIDAVWGLRGSGQTLQWTGAISAAITFRVEAVLPGYTVPLRGLFPSDESITVTPPVQTPAIVVDQAEPVENEVGLSIANAGTRLEVVYALDGIPPPFGLETSTLDVSKVTTGSHILNAQVQLDTGLSLLVSRSLQVHTRGPAVSTQVKVGPSAGDIDVIATADAGIVSVGASLDSVALGTLLVPNGCTPAPCPSGQAFNAYHFSFATAAAGAGSHFITIQATDAAGNTITYNTGVVNLPAATTATLDSPVDGASVAGTLPISGSFASGIPGALELMVTLSGNPVYDTTVANPGTAVPFAVNVSLAGVSSGVHTLGVYARVGNVSYEQMASARVIVD